MRGIMEIDRYVTRVGWLAKYNQQTKTGLSPTEAAEKADRLVLETQPAAHAKDIAEIYATSEFLNWWLQFTNQINQIYNIITYDIPAKFKTGRYWDGTRAGLGVALSAAMIWMISHGRIPRGKEDLKDMAAEASLNYIPVAGSYLNSYRKGFKSGLPPALMPLKTTAELGESGIKMRFGEDRFIREKAKLKAIEKSLELGAFVFRIPFAQPKRSAKGAIRLRKGKTKDYRELIHSEWSLKPLKRKKKKAKRPTL